MLNDLQLKKNASPFIWNGGNPQFPLWTFKNKINSPKIGIIPEDHNYFNKDISNRQVFGYSNKNFDLNTLLENIPYIQIREYTQETRLDLILSLIDCFKRGFVDGENAAQNLKISSQLKNLAHLLVTDLKQIDTVPQWKEIVNIMGQNHTKSENFTDKNIKNWVIDFVYDIYYRILTTSTTNVYTLPFPYTYKMVGNGFDGWENTFNLFEKLGFDNEFAKFILPSFNLTTTPIWKGSRGGEGINIEMSFNLFNDTIEKTINNFIFVNTLIPLNMPLQYAVLTQPPSLYDIKIGGCNRLFMCAGQFECNYKGVFRKPPEKFFNEISKHINPKISKNKFSKFLKDNDIIKIPDIYEITMHFKSLLPNNFNNFIFQFTGANNIIKEYNSEQDKGIMENGEKIVEQIGKWIEDKIEQANEPLIEKFETIYKNEQQMKTQNMS